jgi:hypothetical protein
MGRAGLGAALAILMMAGVVQEAQATHFRYGNVTWKPLDTSGLVEFTVTAAFRNGYGVTTVGQYFNETIGGSTLVFGDGGGTSSTDWHVIALTAGNAVVIARLDPGRTGSNVVLHRYTSAGPFDARIDSCCRISSPTHINNPDGFYAVRTTVFPSFGSIGNSSPVSGMPPIIDFCLNRVNTFLVPASDPNLNPLTFRLATGTEAGSGFVQPGPPHAPNALSINSSTGLITWDTTGATLNGGGETLYSCQVVIEDGSTKIAVDFLIRLIANCTTNNCPQWDRPPTPADGAIINALVGQNINFTVQASDPDAGNLVTLNHLGLPLGASFAPGAPANPASGTFNWTPGAGQAGNYVVQFSASDGNCNVFTSVNIIVTANRPPDCNAGGPYSAECAGASTSVALDGSGSSDPDGDPLTYAWTTNCPGGSFDDASSATPTLTLDGGCAVNCTVTLTVSDGVAPPVSCDASVSVSDTTSPTISCPGDATVTCGDSTDPSATGSASASDVCDSSPDVTYSDSVSTTTCLADPVQQVITRTWTATDACGLSATCPQTITVLKVPVKVDIKPGSCPNGFNPQFVGTIPIAIVGMAGFNVADIVPSSVRISRVDCVGGSAAPARWGLKDTASPFFGTPCDCHTLQGDGTADFMMHFARAAITTQLQLGGIPAGTVVELAISGQLTNGCSFVGVDCLVYVPGATNEDEAAAKAISGE